MFKPGARSGFLLLARIQGNLDPWPTPEHPLGMWPSAGLSCQRWMILLGPLTDRVLPACQDGFARTARPMRCIHCWGPECWSPWVIGSGMCLYDQLPVPIESSGPETGMSAPGRRPSARDRDRQPSARGGARLAGSGEEAGGGARRGSWGSAHSPSSPRPCCVCPASLAVVNLSPEYNSSASCLPF